MSVIFSQQRLNHIDQDSSALEGPAPQAFLSQDSSSETKTVHEDSHLPDIQGKTEDKVLTIECSAAESL